MEGAVFCSALGINDITIQACAWKKDESTQGENFNGR
jgi:hypothetical protein